MDSTAICIDIGLFISCSLSMLLTKQKITQIHKFRIYIFLLLPYVSTFGWSVFVPRQLFKIMGRNIDKMWFAQDASHCLARIETGWCENLAGVWHELVKTITLIICVVCRSHDASDLEVWFLEVDWVSFENSSSSTSLLLYNFNRSG